MLAEFLPYRRIPVICRVNVLCMIMYIVPPDGLAVWKQFENCITYQLPLMAHSFYGYSVFKL